MKIRLFKTFIINVVLLIFLAGCFADDELKVGFSVHNFDSERWEKDKNFFVKKVEDLGGIPLVKVAGGDPDLQIEQCKELISAGVKALVVVPADGEAAAKIVEIAHKAGIQVIAYDRLIKNSDLDYYVSFDNIKVGELQAEYVRKRKPSGNYALIGGSKADNNSYQLKEGHLKVLKPSVDKGDIKIVFDEFMNAWNEEEAFNASERCLDASGDVDVIIAASDILAKGVIKSLQKRGLEGKVMVTGQDVSLNAGRSIVQGHQSMSIYKPIEAIAFTAAITAIKLAKGEPVKNANRFTFNGKAEVPSILLSPTVVDKDNLMSTVVADGYLKEDELYGL